MANRIPLVFDTQNNTLQELPTGDNLNLQGSSIVDAINITASGTITAETINVTNLNANGGGIAAVAISNDYNDLTNLPNLFSGDYNDLTNKPSSISSSWDDITNKPLIPTKLSQLTNDTNFVPNSQVVINNTQVVDLATVGRTGSYTDLVDSNELVTQSQIAGGTLTIDVNNTGDLKGNVLGNDDTIIVNHLTNTFTGSLVGNVTGNLTGDTTGDHIGDVYSRDGSKQVLFVGETSTVDALFRGNVSGQLFAPDDSSILVSAEGIHYGDFKGSVFGDDSTVIVDSINKNINAIDIYATTHHGDLNKTGSAMAITSNSGMNILPGGALSVPNASTISIAATNDITLTASDTIELTSQNGTILINDFDENPFPGSNPDPYPTNPPSDEYRTELITNTRINGGLKVSGDLVIPFGGRLGIREEIVFQDGTQQRTAYQGRELQESIITSGVFYNKAIAEPASGIDWGSSDEFGNHVAVYGTKLLVGAPGFIDGGDTNALGRAYLYDYTTGSLTSTIDLSGGEYTFADRIDANFGASCAANNNHNYVAMPGDDNGNANQAIGNVFVYNNAGVYLSQVTPPAQDVPSNGDMKFGSSIVADDRILVVSAPDYPCPGGGTGRIYVYDSVSSTPVLIDTIDNPYGEGTYGLSLSIYDDPLLVGGSGYFTSSRVTVGSSNGISEFILTSLGNSISNLTSANYENPNPADQNFGKFIAGNTRYIVASAFTQPDDDSTQGGAVYVWDKAGDSVQAGIRDTSKRIRWIFTPSGDEPNINFGRGLSLIEDNILAIAGPGEETSAGMITFYDLNTGSILNQVTLALPDDNAELGRNSVLLTDTHLFANSPGNGSLYVYDYQKKIASSALSEGQVLMADGFGGFGLSDNIPGYVKIADLKTALQDGAGDYAAFKAWVLANL